MWPRVSVVVVTKSAVWVWVIEGPQDIFRWLPIYWANLNFRVWVIWVFGIFYILSEVVGQFLVDLFV